jgi:hypothetical protein
VAVVNAFVNLAVNNTVMACHLNSLHFGSGFSLAKHTSHFAPFSRIGIDWVFPEHHDNGAVALLYSICFPIFATSKQNQHLHTSPYLSK